MSIARGIGVAIMIHGFIWGFLCGVVVSSIAFWLIW